MRQSRKRIASKGEEGALGGDALPRDRHIFEERQTGVRAQTGTEILALMEHARNHSGCQVSTEKGIPSKEERTKIKKEKKFRR